MEEVSFWGWGLLVIGGLLLGYIWVNKNKLKKTILRRLTGGEN